MENNFWWFIPLAFTIYSFTIAYLKHDWLGPFSAVKLDREIYNILRYLMSSTLSMWVWYVYYYIYK